MKWCHRQYGPNRRRVVRETSIITDGTALLVAVYLLGMLMC